MENLTPLQQAYKLQISLKSARVNAKMNLVPAAKALGISKDTLIKWERNSGLVPPVYQKKIASVYGVRIDDIIFGC